VVRRNGARQTGQPTRARARAEKTGAEYFTLDDAAALALAASDPSGFVRHRNGPVVLDEIQRVPALFPALKLAVDKKRKPGRSVFSRSALSNFTGAPDRVNAELRTSGLGKRA